MSRSAKINFVLLRKSTFSALAMIVTHSAFDLLCPNCAVQIAKVERATTPTVE